jgi:hypothetical protein
LVERNAESTASMWIWLADDAALTLPVPLRAL